MKGLLKPNYISPICFFANAPVGSASIFEISIDILNQIFKRQWVSCRAENFWNATEYPFTYPSYFPSVAINDVNE